VIENKANRRPDVVIFINGLPLGVIELIRGAVRITANDVQLGRDGAGTVGLPRPIRQTLLNALSVNIKTGCLPFAVTPTRIWVETGSIVVEGTATNVSLRPAGVAAATPLNAQQPSRRWNHVPESGSLG